MTTRIYKSSFEQAWDETPPGCALTSHRVHAFDSISGLLYAPMKYDHVLIDNVDDNLPSSSWINTAFSEFVRGEFSSYALQEPSPPSPPKWHIEKTTLEVTQKYLEQCETDLVYGGLIDAVALGSSNMFERLYSILKNPLLGNKDNGKFLNKNDFVASIEPLIKHQQRLQFVMPSFPFKDQCIFRTEAPPSHVDFSEIALIIRLHTLALAMYQVHPYGADWILVSDGQAYADIFRVNRSAVEEYQRRLIWYRNFLNLYGTVSIIDLKDMTHRLKSKHAGTEVFNQTVAGIRKNLEKLVASGDQNIYQTFRVLVRGIKKNTNLKDIMHTITWEDHWSILNADTSDDIHSGLKEVWKTVKDIVINAAYEYASFNLAMRYHSVIKRLLPNSLRATIHSKPGQIAVPRLGDVYPWNGVGVVIEREGKLIVETWPLFTILRRKIDAIPYFVENDPAPFFYKIPQGGKT